MSGPGAPAHKVAAGTPALPEGAGFSLAEEVYASALEGAGIGFGGVTRAEGADGSRRLEFEVDAADFDEAMIALARGRDQLAMRAALDRTTERVLRAVAPRRTVVVNLYGGPGSGKTTAALEVSERLKKAGYVVEYVPEYAKELVWQMNDPRALPAQRARAAVLLDGSFSSQRQLYSNQIHRIWRCVGQCDFVVTDSPPALGAVYLKPRSATERKSFERMVMRDMAELENLNAVVRRSGPYEREGRIHDESQAAELDRAVARFLDSHGIGYGVYGRGQAAAVVRDAVRAHERFAGRTAPHGGQGRRDDRMEEEKKGAREVGGWVYVSVPRAGYKGRDSARELEVDGEPMVQLTLPPHVPPVQAAGGPVDVAFHTMLVPPQAVKAWDNDPNYYDVSFPSANRQGEPWTVDLQRRTGHWENPGGKTREERGRWIKGDPVKVRVEASALAESMQEYRRERLDYARARVLSEGREWSEPARPGLRREAARMQMEDAPPARADAASPAADAARAARSAAYRAGRAPQQSQAAAR